MSENYIKFIKIGEDEHPIDATELNSSSSYQIKDNLVTSLSSTSKSTEYPSAACLYRMVGDLSTVDDGSSESDGQLSTQTYTLSLGVTGGLGTITGAESGTYPAGTSFTITAVSTGGTFTGWSDGVTDETRTIVLNSDITLSAIFQLSSNIDDPGELDYPSLDDLLD